MDAELIAIIYATFFVASFVKGVTGLGFAILTLPVVSIFMPIHQAIPLILIPSFASNIIIIYQTKRIIQSVKRFWVLYLSAFPGLYIGVYIMSVTGNQVPRIALGAAAILYSVLMLLKLDLSVPRGREKYYSFPIGFSNGVVNGLTGTQVMPMLPYLMSLQQDMNGIINAINLGFTLSGIVLLYFLSTFHLFDPGVVLYAVIAVIPAAAGIFLGSILRSRLSEEKFRLSVLILLIVIGAVMILMSLH